MNAAAILSPFVSTSASEREKLRAQLTNQIAELDRQDEVERAALRAPIIDQMKMLIAEHNISSAELFPTTVKAEARYQYYDEEEQDVAKRNKTWNGRGTMPNALKGREDESLIPGKKHIKSIEKILADRALSRASTPLPNPGLSEVQAALNAAEPQSDQIMPAANAAVHPSSPSTDTQAVDIKPFPPLTELHLAHQDGTRHVTSAEVSGAALPT